MIEIETDLDELSARNPPERFFWRPVADITSLARDKASTTLYLNNQLGYRIRSCPDEAGWFEAESLAFNPARGGLGFSSVRA
jgi:hypothetical protein